MSAFKLQTQDFSVIIPTKYSWISDPMCIPTQQHKPHYIPGIVSVFAGSCFVWVQLGSALHLLCSPDWVTLGMAWKKATSQAQVNGRPQACRKPLLSPHWQVYLGLYAFSMADKLKEIPAQRVIQFSFHSLSTREQCICIFQLKKHTAQITIA